MLSEGTAFNMPSNSASLPSEALLLEGVAGQVGGQRGKGEPNMTGCEARDCEQTAQR